MTDVFLKIVNMSISASWLVLAVLLFRLVFRKAPKWIHVLLWCAVAVRLLCPFSIESAWSLVPSRETIPAQIIEKQPEAELYDPAMITLVDNPIMSDVVEVSTGTTEQMFQISFSLLSIIWMLGVAAFLAYTVVSYRRLRKKVSTAVILRDNIFQSENVSSPFVLGVIRPKIYLPFEIDGQNLEYVVAHEQAHIRRRDHWWKPLGFLLLTIHWFNPLMWLAYVLLCRDIEMACDEKVIRGLGSEQRADYSQALLFCSTSRQMIAACPLAFGEAGVKERVKSVLYYKKPAFWVIAVSVIGCIIVAVCFLTDPEAYPEEIQVNGQIYVRQEGEADSLPDGSYEAGILERILHRTKEHPSEDFSAVNLDEKYAGSMLYQSGYEADVIYLEDLAGFYIPFRTELKDTDLLTLKQASDNMGDTLALSDSAAIIAYSDLDHDGRTENVVMREIEPDMLYELAVEEEDGTKIWTAEASPAHTGWNTIMLYSEGGQDYLVQYLPAMFQGIGSYTCTVFSLEGGKQAVKDEWSVDFELPVAETPEMERFADEVGILLRNCTVLLSTENGVLVDRPADASGLPQLYPVRFDPDEIQAAIEEADAAFPENGEQSDDSLADVLPLEFLFASGAGAWGTTLTLQPDGTFTGSYSDGEMGSSAPEYPRGTYYVCEFSGAFTDIRKISDYAWSMKLESLATEKQEGQTWIEDEIRYIASEPSGLNDGGDFILYAPGTPADELPADFRDWWPEAYLWREGSVDALSGYGLYNKNTGAGFYTSWLD